MYMSTSQGAIASNYNAMSPSHSEVAQPLVNHDFFKGQTDKQILKDVSKHLKNQPEIKSTSEFHTKVEEKNELVTDYEWKMHKLQVAARNPKQADLAVANKYHPDWYTNKTNMVNRLQGQVEYLKEAEQKSACKTKS